MKKTKTNRGFGLIEFVDRYGAKCSLQKSSIATEDCIWLGVDDPDPKEFVPGRGWLEVRLPNGVHLTTRMHLSQKLARQLLPHLSKFAETGEI